MNWAKNSNIRQAPESLSGIIVVFDICDGDFRFYNSYEWSKKMAIWRSRVYEDESDFADLMTDEDVFDCIHGDESWYTEVPTDI